MSLAIIDYGSGNLHSAAKAFERAARDSGLGMPVHGHRPIPRRCAGPNASCCPVSAPSRIAATG